MQSKVHPIAHGKWAVLVLKQAQRDPDWRGFLWRRKSTSHRNHSVAKLKIINASGWTVMAKRQIHRPQISLEPVPLRKARLIKQGTNTTAKSDAPIAVNQNANSSSFKRMAVIAASQRTWVNRMDGSERGLAGP